ncbi:MAG: enoyl-CoA hydratase/isomerase family protein, partial [Firmicutes bacterium]|nr:enoyl-CoA hydratase/isomerase family protein [Bacillota bacterium]
YYRHIVVEQKQKITLLKINRPEAGNRLNLPCLKELTAAFRAAEEAPEVRVMVLTGVGENFSEGGDLGDFRRQSPAEMRRFGAALVALHRAIAESAKPVIAAVRGVANGGGLSLVEACDLAVATQDATFALPEIGSGLAPMISLAAPARLLPRKGVMEMALLGAPITAQRALEIGLVNWLCDGDDPVPPALAIAERLASVNPTAVALCKRLYREMDARAYGEQLGKGRKMLVTLLTSNNAKEALTAREEGRAPRWQER